MSNEDEFVRILKRRHDFPVEDKCNRFQLSSLSQVSSVFKTWINSLAAELEKYIIVWPNRGLSITLYFLAWHTDRLAVSKLGGKKRKPHEEMKLDVQLVDFIRWFVRWIFFVLCCLRIFLTRSLFRIL